MHPYDVRDEEWTMHVQPGSSPERYGLFGAGRHVVAPVTSADGDVTAAPPPPPDKGPNPPKQPAERSSRRRRHTIRLQRADKFVGIDAGSFAANRSRSAIRFHADGSTR